MNSKRKVLTAAISTVAAVATLAGCATGQNTSSQNTSSQNTSSQNTSSQNSSSQNTSSSKLKPVTLHIMLFGTKPNGFDQVVQKFENETKNTLNVKLDFTWTPSSDYKNKLALALSAGQPVDLAFDAPWMSLRDLASKGDLVDLSKYFNNPQYPALQKDFSADFLRYNEFPGQNGKLGQYAVPLANAYFDPEVIFYRKDLATKYGIGNISNLQQMYQFYDALKKNNPRMTPLAEGADGENVWNIGMTTNPNGGVKQVKSGVVGVKAGSLGGVAYIKNGKLVATYFDGQPASDLSKFPAPYNQPDNYPYKLVQQWHDKGYTAADPINVKDSQDVFLTGNAGSWIGHLSNYPQELNELQANVPGAKLGAMILDPNIAAMKPQSVVTSYQVSNDLVIPVSSKNADRAMMFLNWIFTNEQNNDLFALGIQGKDWVPDGSATWSLPQGASKTNAYSFPGYELTWNSNLGRTSSTFTPKLTQYTQFMQKSSTYYKSPVAGFQFDDSSVKAAMENPDLTAFQKATTGVNAVDLGMTPNATQSVQQALQKAVKNKSLQNNISTIQKAFNEQLSKFLASNH